MLYIAIFILLIVLTYFYDYRRKEEGKLFWLFGITLVFIILGALHYRVGYDSLMYERFYNQLRPINMLTLRYIESSRYAPGFVILASITKVFSNEPILLYLIQSGLVCGVVTWFFIKNTRNVFFAQLLFFIFMFTLLIFEQIRESIAVSFFLMAWPAFKTNNWLKYYALSLCAIAFHTSASFMIILPIILLPGIKQLLIFGKRSWLLFIVVLGVAFVLKTTFSQYIELLSVTQSMEDLTAKYEDTDYVKGSLNIVGILSLMIQYVFYPILALIYFKNAKKYNGVSSPDLTRFEMFVIISICIALLTVGVPIISRFNNYFLCFPIVLMSDWVFNVLFVNKKRLRLSYVYWMLLFIPLFFTQIYASYFTKVNKSGSYKNYMIYYPYTSYLDKEKDGHRVRMIQKAKRATH